MTNSDDDRVLEDYLARRSDVSKRYAELGDEAIPEGLDQRILARATEAVRDVPRRRSLAPRPWYFGLAVAAAAVLAVAVVLETGILNTPDRPTEEQAVRAPGGNVARDTGSDAVSAPAADRGAEGAASLEGIVSEPAPPAASVGAQAPAATPRSPPSESDRSGASTEEALRQRLEHRESELSGIIRDVGPSRAPAEARREPRPQPAASSSMSSLKSEDSTVSSFDDPDTWLEYIARLREAGRDAEADAELERFQAVYPDHPVPEASVRAGSPGPGSPTPDPDD